MADIRVTCIKKNPHHNPDEGITHLGIIWTKSAVIKAIESRTDTFYTMVRGRRAIVQVVEGNNGKYLRTVADGVENDNLLSLPECV